MYYELGQTESGWCSTSNPQGSCKPISGICKPMTTEALNEFKALQNQLNRVATAKGFSKTWVDGRIGTDTLRLYNQVAGASPFLVSYANCDGLASATLRGAITSSVKSMADAAGVAVAVSAPALSRPSVPDPAGGPPKDPPALAITDTVFNMVSSPMGLLIAAGLGYGAYKLATGKKGKGKRPRRMAARARRTARRVRRRRR